MKNILIPTDFSDNARNAIRYALGYFADIPVNFYILHTADRKLSYAPNQQGVFFESTSEISTIQNTSVLLKEEVEMCRILSENSRHSFFSLQEDLNLVEAIRKQVAEKEIDYILMGTKGASKLNGNQMGSNTCDVITKVKCPVMVIPADARFKGIKNIAFVTDYNCIYRNKLISALSENLDLHGAPLRILNIKPQNTDLTAFQTDNKEFLHYFFKETKHSFHFLENREIVTGIQDFVETWEISLVSIVAKNLNFIQRLLLRPSINPVSYTTNVPFLVIHE